MVGLRGDDPDGQHRPCVYARHAEVADQGRQHQNRLGHRELGADADARAGAEWHEREAGRGWLIGHETRWPERFGIIPQLMVTVQNPGRDHYDAARRQFDPRSAVAFDGFSHDREHRGEQAQRLVHNRTRANQGWPSR